MPYPVQMLKTLVACLAAGLFVAACTVNDYNFAPQSKPLRYGDSDPQDFGARSPSDLPVHGIDISKWQGAVDWNRIRGAGIAFAFIKATEGGDFIDPEFETYWRGARAAGIPHAPYHFYYFCTSARDQARWFIQNVPRASVVLPPVLDMEWNHRSPSCKLRPEPHIVRSEMQIFLQMIENHYGKRPIIYTSIDFHADNLTGHFRSYPFWLRSVTAHPDEKYANRRWIFWQYTGTGRIDGVAGDVDINAFGGNRADWTTWLARVTR